jgi:predicted RNA-binding protein with TRAM domain
MPLSIKFVYQPLTGNCLIYILGKSQFKIQMSYNRERSSSRGRSYSRSRSRSYDNDPTKRVKRQGPLPKPVEAGKIYEVDIAEITGKGDGIARVQGFIVFIENGKIGNKIRVKVTEVADRFAKATIEV